MGYQLYQRGVSMGEEVIRSPNCQRTGHKNTGLTPSFPIGTSHRLRVNKQYENRMFKKLYKM